LSNNLGGVRIDHKDHMSILTFFNVTEKDYGNYTCVASNKLGNSNASVILYGQYVFCYMRVSSLPIKSVDQEPCTTQAAPPQLPWPSSASGAPSSTPSASFDEEGDCGDGGRFEIP
ncbi:hypothetical protein AB205_0124560, partial [Aquarana catesbeiana]